MFDASDFILERTANGDDVIELACALVSINNLHEMGEIAFSSDNLLEAGELAMIRQVLSNAENMLENKSRSNLISLYYRLKHYNP